MSAQSLLFDRSAGWTESKAKAWAKSHGYRYGKVDITDQYIRLRQFDPKGTKIKRTIPFGRGIRAIVAREESSNMARTSTVKSSRRKRRPSKKKASSHRRRRRVHAVAAPKRRRHRRAKKTAAVTRRRRRRTTRVEAKRSRRRRSSMVMSPRRRRRRVTREAWRGDSAGHATAARKGHRRRKARSAAPHRRRRRRKSRAAETVMESPRRRRRSKRRRVSSAMESPRRRRRHHVRASRGGGGMGPGGLAMAVVSAGFGYVIADGIDRLIATYNPSATTAPPTDKFTSNGNGTLANTLNVAAMPNWKRVVAGVGVTAVPTVGAMFTDGYVRSSLEGMAIGAGVNLFKTLWNNVLMPMLVGKDTSQPTLQKSYIARLYPAEVSAHINKAANQPAPGALSGAPAGDVGPFALGGDSPYPDAAQALRQQTGVHGDSPYPTAAEALRQQTGVHGDSPYPTAAQALRKEAGVSAWQPGPPTSPGPGPQDNGADCGCVAGDPQIGYASFLGDARRRGDELVPRSRNISPR